MKIGKIKRIIKNVPAPIIIKIKPKPEQKPIPAPDIFQPGKQPVRTK